MDIIVTEAVEHIRIDQLGNGNRRFVFPRLTQEVQGLYRDLRVDLGDLLVFYPEFLEVRTELAMHALFTGFEEGALGLLETNREITGEAIAAAKADGYLFPWECQENRAYLQSQREYAYALCRVGRSEEAARIAAQLVKHDPEDRTGARAVLVRAQLETEQFARVLESTGTPESAGNVELCLAKVLSCIALGWQEEAFYSLAEAYRSWPTIVEEVIRNGPAASCPESLIYPVTEQEQAERYWLDFGPLWQEIPGAVRFVRRFLGARA